MCRILIWNCRLGLACTLALYASRAWAQAQGSNGQDALNKGHTPLAYFLRSGGPAAHPVLRLDWVLTAICCLVCLVTAAMLLVAMFRRRQHAEPRALESKGGLGFVYIGGALSTLALLGIAVYMLVVLAEVADPPREPALTVTVTAYDWWWKIDYGDGAYHFATANEIHIPVGVPVLVRLKSADVIHAFWVPELSGKTQAIPGVENRQWIQADHPGIFRGQCTQYCGVQHAHMAFEVQAQTKADFERWMAAQRAPSPVPATAQTARGAKLFEERCAGCHTVRGSSATGVQAPDLTHVLSRRLIAAGTVVNTPHNLMDWVQHVQEIKPGALMPDMKFSAADASDMSAYLATLK
ncbi:MULTISPECIES: cytochrome c oxidase subunit II [unclassified Caballeronia]|uniref:cytochrome c oxidase subunit II n=1 Tax=unclassified Caballeronia TaxID=2646786 RepID=UPI00285DCC69|nr:MULTISPECIES: cytochrome c oxidase subunit II [unclassified Caballeronia]MDR5763059.1 cytochrome c oxidase subunit II [Caballeronia sp. LZ035]MDR5884186.1 cytochrome c oxidase subunit II [Caballeronia sp. LZ032]